MFYDSNDLFLFLHYSLRFNSEDIVFFFRIKQCETKEGTRRMREAINGGGGFEVRRGAMVCDVRYALVARAEQRLNK